MKGDYNHGIKAAVSQIFTELWLKILFHQQF